MSLGHEKVRIKDRPHVRRAINGVARFWKGGPSFADLIKGFTKGELKAVDDGWQDRLRE